MTNLYLFQQTTANDKCAAYASIYTYMLKQQIPITPDNVNGIVLKINDEVIIDTGLAIEVVNTMTNITNKLFTHYTHTSVEELGGTLYPMLKSNPELTTDCGLALARYMSKGD